MTDYCLGRSNKSTKNATYLTMSYHVQYLLSTVSFLPELMLVEKEARHKRNGQPVSEWVGEWVATVSLERK